MIENELKIKSLISDLNALETTRAIKSLTKDLPRVIKENTEFIDKKVDLLANEVEKIKSIITPEVIGLKISAVSVKENINALSEDFNKKLGNLADSSNLTVKELHGKLKDAEVSFKESLSKEVAKLGKSIEKSSVYSLAESKKIKEIIKKVKKEMEDYIWDRMGGSGFLFPIKSNGTSVTLNSYGLNFVNGTTVLNTDGTVNYTAPSTSLVGYVQDTRLISTTAPLTGGGDLSADRTIAIPASTNSIDGYLTAADHTTFNAKIGGTLTPNTIPKATGAGTIGDSSRTDTGSVVTETLPVTLANLTNALNSGNYALQMKSGVASGADAVAYSLDTTNTINNGKIFSLSSGGTEILKIDNYTTASRYLHFADHMSLGSLANNTPLYPNVPVLYIKETNSSTISYGLYFDVTSTTGNALASASPLYGIGHMRNITGIIPLARATACTMVLSNEHTGGSGFAIARIYDAGFLLGVDATVSAGATLDLYSASHPAGQLPASSVVVAASINFFHARATENSNYYYTGKISTTITGLLIDDLRPRLTYGTKPDTVWGAYILTQTGGAVNNYGLQIDAPSGGSTVNESIWLKGNTTASGVLFGGSKSARIWYNGTNLIINPKLVGSGVLSVLGNISLLDLDFVFGTTTGTKHGTATTQKQSFWNATPIVQPANTVAIDDVLINTGLWASGGASAIFTKPIKITPPPQAISTGAAPIAGNATLVAGTITVSTTAVKTASIVLLTRKTSGGTIGTAITYTISNATSFTINSDNILDTSTFSWFIIDTY